MHVLQAPGVVQIIGSAHAAEPIPAQEIAALQRLMQSGQEGMIVTVIGGPLQGLRGRFVRRTTTCRFIIAVNLIQQAAAVEIAAEHVVAAEDQTTLTCPVA